MRRLPARIFRRRQAESDDEQATTEFAAGALVEDTTPPATDSFRNRAKVRRRLRFLRRLRELELRDLGGLSFEMRRLGRERDDLVDEKVAQLVATDSELRALETLLEDRQQLRELRLPGIGGICSRCGALHASDARFCSDCGAVLREGATRAPIASRVAQPEPATAPAPAPAAAPQPPPATAQAENAAPEASAAPTAAAPDDSADEPSR
ncbi:MAG TPA: zinc ribbon domain-containing protein [Solirubrobacteraceae bacterium]|nr:zinc ribbon domain-containing protein [Solirubrobacteraceae bacterium]